MCDLMIRIKEKIKMCSSGITPTSTAECDVAEAQAIEHLARALSYLHQINKEDKE